MKNILLTAFILVVVLFGCTAPSYPISEPIEESSAERSAPTDVYDVPIDLGVPLFERYGSDVSRRIAMTPRDLIIHDGVLYVGSGDWGGNLGPVEMQCYDLTPGVWKTGGTLLDEEVNSFFLLEDTLLIPGIDPRESWEWGNLYVLQEGTWQTLRSIPRGIHCFDLAYVNETLFAAVKTERDFLEVAVSYDMGNSFHLVPLQKNDAPVTDVRFYFDLITIGNEVYALCYKELYRYDGNAFIYSTSWEGKVERRSYNAPQKMNLFSAKATVGEITYFSTGRFYACYAADDVRELIPPRSEVVQDLYLFQNKLYLLCNLLTDEGYVVTVYQYLPQEETFLQEASFQSAIPAVSMAYDGKAFYFGMASNNTKHIDHGRILKIETLYVPFADCPSCSSLLRLLCRAGGVG